MGYFHYVGCPVLLLFLFPPSSTRTSLPSPPFAMAQNMRGGDPPECSNNCDGGGCDYRNCRNNAVNCGGGGCEFHDCRNPSCAGGGCAFFYCTNPRCGGGGCTFVGCQGGDNPADQEPLTEEEEKEKAVPLVHHNTWSELSEEERDVLLSPNSGSNDDGESVVNRVPQRVYDNIDHGR